MKHFISKYFLETNKYFVRIFCIGLAILAVAASVSWSIRLGEGWIVYLIIALFWIGAEYNRYTKEKTKS